MEKKAKIKKMKNKKDGRNIFSSLLFSIIALIVAGGLFVGMLVLQNYFAKDVVYREVVTALETVPEGEIITEENFSTYFTLSQVNVLNTTEGALTKETAQDLLGKKARVTLYKGEEVSIKDFDDVIAYMEAIENPVEISVEVGSLSTADGGKVRAGDLVNITLMFSKAQLKENMSTQLSETTEASPSSSSVKPDTDFGSWVNRTLGREDDVPTDEAVETPKAEEPEETDGPTSSYTRNDGTSTNANAWANPETKYNSLYNFDAYSQYVLENIYVKQVLTADGAIIDPTDTTSVASIYIFVIPREMELELNNALENCTSMRVSKVINKVVKGDKNEASVDETENETAVEEIPIKAEEPVVDEVPTDSTEVEGTDEAVEAEEETPSEEE